MDPRPFDSGPSKYMSAEKYAGTNTFTVYTAHQEGPKGTLFTEVITALFDPKKYILKLKLTVF